MGFENFGTVSFTAEAKVTDFITSPIDVKKPRAQLGPVAF